MEQWAGVVRISHMGGRVAGADNVHADRDQLDAMTQHAASHGARLHVLAPELDVSGGLPLEQRPSLLAAIEGVERGQYDAIVVAYLSRLGRNVREQLRAWDRVEAAGGRIIVVREGIDTSTPTGRLQRTIMLGIAEHEREQHAERFENLREWATMAGVWQRRQTPLGYTRDPTTRKLAPDADAGRVRRAFADRIAGKPMGQIARELGMTTSGGRSLLANRVYLGELRVGRHVNVAAHPPIVDAEMFDGAQRARVTRPTRVAEHPALLSGLVRCAGCGHMMSSSEQKVRVYGCSVNHSAGRCPAPAAITARLLDEYVERVVLVRLEQIRLDAPRDDGPLRAARAVLRAAEGELGAFLRGVTAAGLEPGQFAAAALERRESVDAARAGVADALASRLPAAVDGDPVAAWEGMDGTHRNRLLCRLVEVVLVARAGGRGHVVPLESRVRVIRYGAGVVDTKRYRGRARPLVTVGLPDAGDPRVLRVDLAHDEL